MKNEWMGDQDGKWNKGWVLRRFYRLDKGHDLEGQTGTKLY